MQKIVLASSSPRRKDLLENLGLHFTVDASNIEEELDNSLAPQELALTLSQTKARAIAPKYNDALIIAADTFGVLDAEILGKPHTAEEACKMLAAISSKTHLVITGFTILDTASGKMVSQTVETAVTIRKLSVAEINAYVATGEPLDKAGGYAIQGLGAVIVEKVEGDFYNVIGLPLFTLTEVLKGFGVNILIQGGKRLKIKGEEVADGN